MKKKSGGRRGPAGHITLTRAARLHRMVAILSGGPQPREAMLSGLGIGLRTFYRELELLKKCGIKVRMERKLYLLKTTAGDAEGRLPFPDPQLSFAEMAELARHPGDAARRLAELLARVVGEVPASKTRKSRKANP